MKVKQKGPEMEQLRREGKIYREIASAVGLRKEQVEGYFKRSRQEQRKKVTSMGYPVSYFDGDQMMFAKGPVSTRVGQEGHWIMYGSKMGPGSSGGAWVLEDNLTAVGLNAYIVTSGKEIMYSGSPQFNDDFEKLYQYALTLM